MAERMVLSRHKILSTVSDKEFIRRFPKFAVVQTVQSPSPRLGGCSGCRKRRRDVNTMNAFLTVLKGLKPHELRDFKNYINANSVVYNTHEDGRYKVGKL